MDYDTGVGQTGVCSSSFVMCRAVDERVVNRRRVLQAVAGLGASGLAGCIGGRPTEPGDTHSGTPRETSSAMPPHTPGEPATSFVVTSRRCGNQVNDATVSFGDGTVTVEGTTWGSDACTTGRLDAVTLEGGTLTVAVVTERVAPDDQACAQCISEIHYTATVAVSPPPDEVVVTHDGETVATARP